MKQNQVIIQEVSFDILNYNGTGKDYVVNAYAQDPEENDMYTIEINEMKENGELSNEVLYHADSNGNVAGDEADFLNDDLTMLVHTILFIRREHGIVKGF